MAIVAGVSIASPAIAQAPLGPPTTGGMVAVARYEQQRGTHKRVLLIGAHPDDEDTELLAWLARGQGAQAAYLSLNRGEGGQNSIGAELGEALGLLRTEELLSAREVDGARQFFTRAYDFGFSRSLDDTWAQWPHDTVLKDVVRVVRAFRPQIIVSVSSGTARDGHGQHQAAGVMAREVFRAAADPAIFPELGREEGLAAYAPQKLFRSTRFDTGSTTLVIAGGIVDQADGRTYHQIAMDSRSRHQSQDMGQLQTIGASSIRLALVEARTGSAAGAALFAGIDTTLTATDVTDMVRAEQQSLADRADAARAGLLLDAVADVSMLVAGDSALVTVLVAGDAAGLADAELGLATVRGLDAQALEPAVRGEGQLSRRFVVRVRESRAGQPYFLRRARLGAMYQWPPADAAPLGQPFDTAPVTATVSVPRPAGRPLVLAREVSARANRRTGGGEFRQPLVVVPQLSVDVGLGAIVRPTTSEVGPLPVMVRNLGRRVWTGRVRLVRDDGVSGSATLLTLQAGRDTTLRIAVMPATGQQPATYTAQAVRADGVIADQAVREIVQAHVPYRAWLVPATVTVHRAVVTAPRGVIGYVRGPSDLVPEALAAAGIMVRELDAAAVSVGAFEGLGSIVIGPRAYETRDELRDAGPSLQAFAARGGIVLLQYQWPLFAASTILPKPITMSADRVTDEAAPITVLEPTAPELRIPHRIGDADWDGWVQERGLQFARTWDPAWRAPLELHDVGDTERRGALLIAAVGKGKVVYTGLSFFRQLPAGVPGALRLFLNLLSAAR